MSDKITSIVERNIPQLSYIIVEGNLKHLQGQILTLLEASMDSQKLDAVKSLVRGYFNNKLTYFFDMYGQDGSSENEIPLYSDESYLLKNEK
jgi:predicted metal-dependent enzyme (double-stranded beta helix superfamily)